MDERLFAELIDFQTFRTLRSRMNLIAIAGMAKAQNRPLPCRQFNVQRAVFLQMSRKIEHLIHGDQLIGGHRLRGGLGNRRVRAHPRRLGENIGQTSGGEIQLVELHRHLRIRSRCRELKLHKFHARIRKPLDEFLAAGIKVLHPATEVR